MNNPSKATEKVDVIVEVDSHTHAGKPVAKGDHITVSPRIAERLVSKKVGRIAAAAAQAENKKEAR